jgi:hypothetical protein
MLRVRNKNPRDLHEISNRVENGVDNSKKLIEVNGKTLYLKDYNIILEIEDYLSIRFFEYSYCRFGKIEMFYTSFLGFSQEQMDKLIELLSQFTSLEKLNLNNNSLSHISPKIGAIKGLKQLFLQSNQLYSLPKTFENLSSLTHLYLHFNRFEIFPPEILKLPKLSVLTLNNNNIRNIPEALVKLDSLKILTLHSNYLETIPENLGEMPNLEFIPIAKQNILSLTQTSIIAYSIHIHNCFFKVGYYRYNVEFFNRIISNEAHEKTNIAQTIDYVNYFHYFLLILEDN